MLGVICILNGGIFVRPSGCRLYSKPSSIVQNDLDLLQGTNPVLSLALETVKLIKMLKSVLIKLFLFLYTLLLLLLLVLILLVFK